MTTNSEMHPMTLGDMISIISSLPYGNLYLSGNHPWNVTTLSLIVVDEPHDVLEDETKALLAKYDLEYVIESAVLEDVVSFAHRQKSRLSLQELVDAFNYYFIYDAFMLMDTQSGDPE